MLTIISGIQIEVQKKKIKNLHLYVKPPDGHVIVSAPQDMNESAIEMFIKTKLGWIKTQQKKYDKQLRFSKRQYISGETMYIWGRQCFLKFVEDNQRNSFKIQGNNVILSMRKDSTVSQRENYVREQYRVILKEKIFELLPKWEKTTGLKCDCWQTKYMTTRWGTCNYNKKRLWFNLQLAQKPVECLEYVILHELAHLQEQNHGVGFVNIMDANMPYWREIRKKLNEQVLDYYNGNVEIDD